MVNRKGRRQFLTFITIRLDGITCGRYSNTKTWESPHGDIPAKKKREFVNITQELERALAKAQIKEGLVLASAMHITAGVYINDAEDGLIADIEEWLEKLAPFRQDYRHHRTGEDNGDAHLKNLLIGHQVLVPVTNGKLDLGPWQQVYYAEFDGQRRKRVLIKVVGE